MVFVRPLSSANEHLPAPHPAPEVVPDITLPGGRPAKQLLGYSAGAQQVGEGRQGLRLAGGLLGQVARGQSKPLGSATGRRLEGPVVQLVLFKDIRLNRITSF